MLTMLIDRNWQDVAQDIIRMLLIGGHNICWQHGPISSDSLITCATPIHHWLTRASHYLSTNQYSFGLALVNQWWMVPRHVLLKTVKTQKLVRHVHVGVGCVAQSFWGFNVFNRLCRGCQHVLHRPRPVVYCFSLCWRDWSRTVKVVLTRIISLTVSLLTISSLEAIRWSRFL